MVNRKATCRCRPGFTGRYCEDVKLDLTCDDQMRLQILKSVFDDLGVNSSLLHMSNPNCKVQETSELHVSITLTYENHTYCGTQVQVNGSHLVYSNELTTGTSVEKEDMIPGGGLISRSSNISIRFFCVYRYDRIVSLPYPLLTSASLVTFVVQEGEFNVTMTLHQTSAFLKPYYWPPIIPLSHRLYVQLQMHGPQTNFTLKLEECWATPAADPSHEIKHPIITNGQANDSTVAMISSGNGSLTRFSLQMFHFVSYTEVYLHCRIWLCQSNTTECLDKQEQSIERQRRDLSDDPYRKILSCGPIKLVRTTVSSVGNPDSGIRQLTIPASFAAGAVLLLLCLVAVAKALKVRRLTKGPDACNVSTTS
ncbi:pancreatic secretory granule membrane major glycoprotein GP2-like [Ascaphus truei]|uniref:pancreatic secretory granule membrane major glycoprotein GP2-like n=1 Tax=Ascaphus truei TaxID=8439 RepID=UPI003F5961EF